MRARIRPGGKAGGETGVPGDKSIAHRWLILAATAEGRSELRGLPRSLDVRSTARCLAQLLPGVRPQLEAWASRPVESGEGHGFTWDVDASGSADPPLVVEGEGREALAAVASALDCGNSGTTMRLLAGVLASAPFSARLTGDASLLARPMERVARPLREMGATVRTNGGRAPIEIEGGLLHGIVHELAVASAQVKGAILLAGLAAGGETSVIEPVATRDHTERALEALGAPVRIEERRVTVAAFQQKGFEGAVPGDVSAASFLVAAAALSGTELLVHSVGLNPSRTRFLDVMGRMGVRSERTVLGTYLGEPVGDLHVLRGNGIEGTQVEATELPLVIDEVPVLAALAAHANGDSLFTGAAELRMKESDRLAGLAAGIRALGGLAEVEGDDLSVAGGGLAGGAADALGDHRMAMALTVAALAASGPSEIEGMESAAVSFPGFVATLARLGAWIEG